MKAKEAIRERKKGRAKGFVIIGVRKDIKIGSIEEWRCGQVVRGVKTKEEPCLSIIVANINFDVNIDRVFRELKQIAENLTEDSERIIIVGDFIARIGHWQINKEGEREELRQLK